MHDIVEQLLGYLRGIWRYRWYALGLAWIVCIAGWVGVQRLPDKFEASARVYVDTQSILRPLLRGLTVDVNTDSQVQLMTRTLLSRPNLEKVARMTDLDLKARDTKQMDELIDGLAKNISLRSAGRENLYSIIYQDRDPQFAKKVVQSLLTIFVENALGETRQDSDSAQRFLDKQIAEYEARLLAAEERVKTFKRQNLGIMPDSGQDHYARMQTLSGQLAAARLELRESEKRRDALSQQIEGELPTFGYGSRSSAADPKRTNISLPVDARIQGMQERLDQLLLQFTDKHPDVIAVRQTLADLKKQRDAEVAEITKSMAATTPAADGDGSGTTVPADVSNPLYQQIKLTLSQEEANIAAVKVRVQEYESRLAEMQKLVNSVPEIEAQLKALNRDYEVTRQNYDQLLARRESARLSQQAGQTNEDIRFKVIDPPRVPNTPTGPNRLALMTTVFVAGLVAGLVLAFLMAQLRPTFDNRRILTEITNLPVLGSVSMIVSPQVLRRQKIGLISYAGMGAMLVIVYAGLAVAQATGYRLL